MHAGGKSRKHEPFKGWLIFFFFINCEFVLVDMSYDLKMEILNRPFSLIPNLGFGEYHSHIDVRGTFSVLGEGLSLHSQMHSLKWKSLDFLFLIHDYFPNRCQPLHFPLQQQQ